MLSTFQSASGSAGSASGSHGSHRTDTASSRRGAGGEGGAGPYATTTLVCSARTASTAPCSSGSTVWPTPGGGGARVSVCVPRSPAPPLQQQQQQHCLGHYDNYQYGSHASHPGSPSPLDHRDAALSLQLQPPRAGTGTLGRENRRLKLLRRQVSAGARAPPTPTRPRGETSAVLIASYLPPAAEPVRARQQGPAAGRAAVLAAAAAAPL
ncbi:hypothetical protein ONE63_005692 [Megalurothrips usitatus]|uniref:Uncharacterized protein n=1 Tax=Megalurothrips usitatus TaxID=439358 RepID=A0AAV7XWC6_9NEOP|nr:hypothetical protein ONE63_005692 [Megalurothrips usitatus]